MGKRKETAGMDDLFERLAEAWTRRSEGGVSRIFTVPEDVKHLDAGQLARLEKALRAWVDKAGRKTVRASRRRMLLLFLIIRHAGARLGEACACDPAVDYRPSDRTLALGQGASRRWVPLAASVSDELEAAMRDGVLEGDDGAPLNVDQAHLRRKLYERAGECGLPRELVNPTIIRRSRGIELLCQNVPLPVVQRVLGQSTPNLAGEYLDFSDADMDSTVRRVMDRESRRTSARNSFFGKITAITRGDIQSEVRLASVGGHDVTAVITNGSLDQLGFREGGFATAEVKAPWVIVSADSSVRNSAVNRFSGVVARIVQGRLTSEVVVRLGDGLEVCAIITEESRRALGLAEGESVQVMFNAFAIILNAE
jgi:molybdate transport system regulatory protein